MMWQQIASYVVRSAGATILAFLLMTHLCGVILKAMMHFLSPQLKLLWLE